MPTYVIGDIQGCHSAFLRLLARMDFRPGRDRLWLTGDLVNRGPDSLEMLRWARAHEEHLVAVLGNHDAHLLARAAGHARAKAGDTLDALLDAVDREQLLAWLRRRPFLYEEEDRVLVHAGLLPVWSLGEARTAARELEDAVADGWPAHLKPVGKRTPLPPWRTDLPAADRMRVALAAFTRLRTCREDGTMCLQYPGPPHDAPPGCVPWFAHPARRITDRQMFHGHWATLGFHRTGKVVGLDSGCVWGGSLTAYRIEDGTCFREPAAAPGTGDG